MKNIIIAATLGFAVTSFAHSPLWEGRIECTVENYSGIYYTFGPIQNGNVLDREILFRAPWSETALRAEGTSCTLQGNHLTCWLTNKHRLEMTISSQNNEFVGTKNIVGFGPFQQEVNCVAQ